jgi:hypothetical protein
VLTGFILQILTFPSACEGARGDIHGVQHDLHRAVRVPQAVTTASRATPPCPHPGGSVKLRYQLMARLWTLRVSIPSLLRENGWYGSLLRKKSTFRLRTHAQSPLPLPCTYIFTIQYYELHILGLSVLFVLVIVPPMTITANGEAGEIQPLQLCVCTCTLLSSMRARCSNLMPNLS